VEIIAAFLLSSAWTRLVGGFFNLWSAFDGEICRSFFTPGELFGKKEDQKIRYSQLEIQSPLISIYNKILSIDLDLILKMKQVLKIN
jgi:hypothetical protein